MSFENKSLENITENESHLLSSVFWNLRGRVFSYNYEMAIKNGEKHEKSRSYWINICAKCGTIFHTLTNPACQH